MGVEVHFFAAQTMRMKIQLAFTEVPEESHASLRDALCQSIGTLGGEHTLFSCPLGLLLTVMYTLLGCPVTPDH